MTLRRLSVLIVVVCGTWVAVAGAGGPRIRIEQPSFDFGTIFQEEVVTHEFTVRNAGEEPLKIGKVSSSCGCTAALTSQNEVAPGSSAKIKVTFRAGRMRDKVKKQVYVESNDPVEPRTVLTISGFIKREVDLVPSSLYLGRVAPGEAVEREVVIRPVEVKKFRILEVKVDHEAITVSGPEPIADKQGGYRLNVRVGPVSTPKRITASVILRTDLDHAKDLRIPVYANVMPRPTQPPGPGG